MNLENEVHMRLLFGTKNPAKLTAMQRRLAPLQIEIIGLQDMMIQAPDIPETGSTPLENARQKAMLYYKTFHMPVFACDTGLYLENVPDHCQPGVHVRTVGGRCLTDEEMAEYYAGLARQYGNLTARYQNAVCLVMDEDHIYEAMDPSLESRRFRITDRRRPIRRAGFPLDSMSVDIETGKYFYDLPEDYADSLAVEDGFLLFFKGVAEVWQELAHT